MAAKVLSLASASQKAPGIVRAEFASAPRAKDAQEAQGALNPANWKLSGPVPTTVAFVKAVSGYPKKFDLFATGPLVPGKWTLSVSNVVGPFDRPLTAPTEASFSAVAPDGYSAFTVVDSPSEADALRSFLNPALKGVGWTAVVQTVGSGEQRNRDDAALAFRQRFTSTAVGKYLTRLAAGQGIDRPPNAGMSDPDFSALVSTLRSRKATEGSLRAALEPFYGRESIRGSVLSAPEPFALSGGEDLDLVLDGSKTVKAVFAAADFQVPGQASAAEAAAAIGRALEESGSLAKAFPFTSPSDGLTRVEVLSASLGPRSSVEVMGGQAQNALAFPAPLALLNGSLPTWTVTPDPATGNATFSASGASGLDLSGLREGDYVNVFGSEFFAANRGSFPVLSVSVTYPGPAQSFVVANRKAANQVGLAQLSASSILYFRPVAARPFGGPEVSSDGSIVRISLPATAASVKRAPGEAAYLRGTASVPVTALTRLGTIVTASAVTHGLSVGSQVELAGSSPSAAPPATVVGTPPNLDASNVSIYASTAVSFARFAHVALRLADGRAFTVGGFDLNASANLTDGRLATFSGPTVLTNGERRWAVSWAAATAFPGSAPRGHAGSLLADGRVLVTGGEDAGQTVAYNQAYLYTPDGGAGTWTAAPNMGSNRARHRQVTLQNGKVLIVGGIDTTTGTYLTSCDLYDPAANTMIATGSMSDSSTDFALVLLADGRVLRIGGMGKLGNAGIARHLYTCEVYDPGGGTWSRTGDMAFSRVFPASLSLADGRVMVGGGAGQRVSDPDTFGDALASCELWTPATGRWSPGPTMSCPKEFPSFAVLGSKVYANGGVDLDVVSGVPETLDYLDLSEAPLRWRRSTAKLAVGRARGTLFAINGEVALFDGGLGDDSSKPLTDEVLVAASDAFGLGSLNGRRRVSAVPDPNHFSFETPEAAGYWADASTSTVAWPQAALNGIPGIPGAHVWDPDGRSPAITSVETTSAATVFAGVRYDKLPVADASAFPDAPGWLCLGIGRSFQASPVKYLGRSGPTSLILDFSSMATTVPSGSKVHLLRSKSAFVPDDPLAAGSLYLTDSPAGRAGAQNVLGFAAAAGTEVEVSIKYPGDRGLGNEGAPTSGTFKLSDAVEVWAESPDQEVPAARSAP